MKIQRDQIVGRIQDENYADRKDFLLKVDGFIDLKLDEINLLLNKPVESDWAKEKQREIIEGQPLTALEKLKKFAKENMGSLTGAVISIIAGVIAT